MPSFRPRRPPTLPLALLALLVAACVPRAAPPPPAPPPRPTPAPVAPPPPLAANWEDWPRTPGTWRYERDARGSRAMFGAAGSDALAVLRCDLGTRQVYLSRSGTVAGAMTIRTSAMARALAAQSTGGTPPYVAVALSPRDALLDAIAFTRGRFAIEQPGLAPLVLPPYAEVARVIEDCRA